MSKNVTVYRGGWSVENLATNDSTREPSGYENDIAHTLLARDYKGLCNFGANAAIEVIRIGKKMEIRLGNLNGATGVVNVETLGNYMPSEHNASRVVDSEGIAPTVMENHGTVTGVVDVKTAVQKDNLVLEETVLAYDEQNQTVREETFGTLTTDGSSPKHNNRVIKIKQATKQGFIECEVGGVCCLDYPTSELRRGRVIENGQVSPTLTTENIPSRIEFGNPDFYNFLYEIDGEIYLIRIRKLIPKECWRLMGFTDEDFEKAQKVNSNTQLYKQAGNSIVVNCLEAIMSQMDIQGIPKWNDINK